MLLSLTIFTRNLFVFGRSKSQVEEKCRHTVERSTFCKVTTGFIARLGTTKYPVVCECVTHTSCQNIREMVFIWWLDSSRAAALTSRHGDAVALGVEVGAHRHEVALAFHLVLDARGLHEEGVVPLAVAHALHALRVSLGEDGGPRRRHGGPHALVVGEVGVLSTGGRFS